MPSLKEKVQRGAALLDKRRPGWSKQLLIEDLDMSNDCHCALGQLFGRYNRSVAALVVEAGGRPADAFEFSQEHGFTIVGKEANWSVLEELWLCEIDARNAEVPFETALGIHAKKLHDALKGDPT